MADAPATVLDVVAFQAIGCEQAGSPLYGRILTGVADDLRAGGPSSDLLADRGDDPFGSALALRLMGAVHRVVLEGRAPDLAAFYPSVGGRPDAGDPVRPFLAAIAQHRDEISRRIDDGVQTNEVGRSAVLVGGYADVARRTGLPLRVLEVGASAGLNLRWDHYGYDTGAGVSGDPTSPLIFSGAWTGPPPTLPPAFQVGERRGCDRNPLDATTDEGRLTLLSYVWPDQVDRIARLDAAIEVARRVPAPVDRVPAPEWIADQLADPRTGVATVVTHSIVMQYLSADARHRFREAVADAGRRATAAAPLAWLRMEPAGDRAELRCTQWPSGEDVVLGTAGYHGRPIWWNQRL